MGFSDFWIELNNNKERLQTPEENFGKERILPKFSHIFDFFDKNHNGKLEQQEIDFLAYSISCAAGDNLLTEKESKDSIFSDLGEEKADFLEFVKAISDSILYSNTEILPNGEKKITAEYKDGTKDTIYYYADGEFKFKLTEKKNTATYNWQTMGNVNANNKPESKQSLSFDIINHTETEELPPDRFVYLSERASKEAGLKNFIFQHLIDTTIDAQNALKSVEVLDKAGDIIKEGLEELGLGNNTENLFHMKKNIQDNKEKTNNFLQFLMSANSCADMYFDNFEERFNSVLGHEYEPEKAEQFQQLATTYQSASYLSQCIDTLSKAIEELKQYNSAQLAMQFAGSNYSGTTPAQHMLKFRELIVQIYDNDTELADLMLNSMPIDDHGMMDITSVTLQLQELIRQNETALSETLNGKKIEDVKAEYIDAYRNIYNVKTVPEEVTDKVVKSKEIGGIVKIAIIMAIQMIITKQASPILAGEAGALEGTEAAITASRLNAFQKILQGLITKYGQETVANGLNIAVQAGFVPADIGLGLISGMTGEEGLTPEKVKEVMISGAHSSKYVAFSWAVTARMSQAITQSMNKIGLSSRLFNSAKTLSGGQRVISGTEFLSKLDSGLMHFLGKGAAFSADGIAFGAFDYITSDIDGGEATQNAFKMQLELGVARHFLETLLGVKVHAKIAKAKQKANLKNIELIETKTDTKTSYTIKNESKVLLETENLDIATTQMGIISQVGVEGYKQLQQPKMNLSENGKKIFYELGKTTDFKRFQELLDEVKQLENPLEMWYITTKLISKVKEGAEFYRVHELTDEEFVNLRKDVELKIENLPEQNKNILESSVEKLTKENIQIIDRIISSPNFINKIDSFSAPLYFLNNINQAKIFEFILDNYDAITSTTLEYQLSKIIQETKTPEQLELRTQLLRDAIENLSMGNSSHLEDIILNSASIEEAAQTFEHTEKYGVTPNSIEKYSNIYGKETFEHMLADFVKAKEEYGFNVDRLIEFSSIDTQDNYITASSYGFNKDYLKFYFDKKTGELLSVKDKGGTVYDIQKGIITVTNPTKILYDKESLGNENKLLGAITEKTNTQGDFLGSVEYVKSKIKGEFEIYEYDINGKRFKTGLAEFDKNGGKHIERRVESLDKTVTENIYADDKLGNRYSYYKITDAQGNVLYESKKIFKVIDKNHFISTNDGQSYDILFSDEKVTVTKLDTEGNLTSEKVIYKIKDYTQTDYDIIENSSNAILKDNQKTDAIRNGEKTFADFLIEEGVIEPHTIDRNLLPALKQLPGEEWFSYEASNLEALFLENEVDNGHSYGKAIGIGKNKKSDLSLLEHESGHIQYELSKRKTDTEFLNIYNTEKALCEKYLSEIELEQLDYFLYVRLSDPKNEASAEGHQVTNAPNSREEVGSRSMFLEKYMPKTIAYAESKNNLTLQTKGTIKTDNRILIPQEIKNKPISETTLEEHTERAARIQNLNRFQNLESKSAERIDERIFKLFKTKCSNDGQIDKREANEINNAIKHLAKSSPKDAETLRVVFDAILSDKLGKEATREDVAAVVQHLRRQYKLEEQEIIDNLIKYGANKLGTFSSRIKGDMSEFDKIANYALNHPDEPFDNAIKDVRDNFGGRITLHSVDIKAIMPELKALIDAGDFDKAGELGMKKASEAVAEFLLNLINSKNKVFKIERISNYQDKSGISIIDENTQWELETLAVNNGFSIVNSHWKIKAQGSGYPAFQINLRTKSGRVIELQIRFDEVNEYAESEHFAYDIMTKKDIIGRHPELEKLFSQFKDSLLNNITEEEYEKYYIPYTRAQYHYRFMKAIGIDLPEPKLDNFTPPPGKKFPPCLKGENLLKLHELAEKVKSGELDPNEAVNEYNRALFESELTTKIELTKEEIVTKLKNIGLKDTDIEKINFDNEYLAQIADFLEIMSVNKHDILKEANPSIIINAINNKSQLFFAQISENFGLYINSKNLNLLNEVIINEELPIDELGYYNIPELYRVASQYYKITGKKFDIERITRSNRGFRGKDRKFPTNEQLEIAIKLEKEGLWDEYNMIQRAIDIENPQLVTDEFIASVKNISKRASEYDISFPLFYLDNIAIYSMNKLIAYDRKNKIDFKEFDSYRKPGTYCELSPEAILFYMKNKNNKAKNDNIIELYNRLKEDALVNNISSQETLFNICANISNIYASRESLVIDLAQFIIDNNIQLDKESNLLNTMRYINDENIELAKKLFTSPEFPQSQIFNIIYNTYRPSKLNFNRHSHSDELQENSGLLKQLADFAEKLCLDKELDCSPTIACNLLRNYYPGCENIITDGLKSGLLKNYPELVYYSADCWENIIRRNILSNEMLQKDFISAGRNFTEALARAKNDNIIELYNRLKEDALANKNILKSGIDDITDKDILDAITRPTAIDTIDLIGIGNTEAAFPLMLDEFKNFLDCMYNLNIELTPENRELLVQKINPTQSQKAYDINSEITALKQKLNTLVGDKNLAKIKNLQAKKTEIDKQIKELKANINNPEIKEKVKELQKQSKILGAQAQSIYYQSENAAEIKELMKDINSKQSELKAFLAQQPNIEPQLVVTKMLALSALTEVCTKDEIRHFINLIKTPNAENEAAWNEAINKKIYQKIGIEYDEVLSQKLDLSHCKYITELFISSEEFFDNMKELVEVIRNNPSLTIEEAIDQLPQNVETKRIFESLGISFDKFTKIDKNSYTSVKIELNAEEAKQASIKNLEEDLNDNLFKILPKEVTEPIFKSLKEKLGVTFEKSQKDNWINDGFDNGSTEYYRLYKNGNPITFEDMNKIISIIKKEIITNDFWTTRQNNNKIEIARETIYKHLIKMRSQEVDNALAIKGGEVAEIEIHKTDMYDIKKAIGLGNDGDCCTGLAKHNNEWTAPTYIMNKCIGAIELTDKGEFVGNTMIYLAYVDGEPALVLDNIELKSKFQRNDKIRDAFMEYAKKLCTEIGKPDLPIYAGPNRHKLNMDIYPKSEHTMEIIGNSGSQEVYIDYDANGHVIGDETEVPVQINLYKIR